MDIVLINPEIPQNTGSIARTCAATRTPLHLVGPLGFEITEKNVRRAGLDYWPHVDLAQHDSWSDYMALRKPATIWMFTKRAKRPYYEATFGENDALVFGSETRGLDDDFLSQVDNSQHLVLPILCEGVRSLNLSNAVSIALYEALRRLGKI